MASQEQDEKLFLSASIRLYITVGLLSIVVIMLELLQTRILAFIFSNNIVYLTISIALLGFGIGGTFIAMNLSRISNLTSAISLFLLLLGVSVSFIIAAMLFSPALSTLFPLFRVACFYLVCLFPFVFAGSILSIVFATAGCLVGKLYAVDLLSAGVSCVLFFFLLPALGAGKLLGCLIALAAMLSYSWANKQQKRVRLLATVLCAMGLTLMVVPIDHWMCPESYKAFSKIMTVPGSKIEHTVWTPLSRVDVIGEKKPHPILTGKASSFPGYLNLQDFESGSYKVITQDGIAPALMWSYSAMLKTLDGIRPGVVSSGRDLVYVIRHNPTVAIIGFGGGYDALTALGYGAKDVYGAEINPSIFHFIMHDYFDYHGHLLERDNLHLYNEEGRSMLRQLDCKLDVIWIQHVFTHAALTDSAYVFSENYLYTVEALKEYYRHLKPDGILSITRHEGVEGLRLISLVCQSLRESGCHSARDHIVAIVSFQGNEKCIQLLVKNQPFTNTEVQLLLSASRNLDDSYMLFHPSMINCVDTMSSCHQIAPKVIAAQQRRVFNLISSFDRGTEKNFFAGYPYVITPTRDDSPFFFMQPRRDLWSSLKFDKLYNTPIGTLFMVIVQSTVFTIVAIFLPLWKFNREGIAVPHATTLSVYFSCLGFGFMLFEIGIMQKCVLCLGNPLYSLSIILSTLLISAGVGSAIITKLNWNIGRVVLVFGTLFLMVAFAVIFALNSFMYSLMQLPLQIRMLSTFCVLFPLGITMGTFFPSGLQFVRNESNRYLPWAFGINGCASVYGSFAAIILAVYFGLTITLIVGTAIYALAFISGLYAQKTVATKVVQVIQ